MWDSGDWCVETELFQLITVLFTGEDDADITNAIQFAMTGGLHVNAAPPGPPGRGRTAVVWDGAMGDTWPGEL
jgi:hypothetical protein